MNILPKLNTICKFTFVSKFSLLDGVYKVVKILTYEQANNENIDFIKYLYTPAGVEEEQYTVDMSSYKNDTIIELHTMNNNVVYVYASLLSTVPDPTVSVYDYIVFGATVGYFKSPMDYAWLVTTMEEILKTKLGSTASIKFLADPEKKKWMTDNEYDEMDKNRQQLIKNDPSSYVKVSQLQNENLRLRSVISMYETLLMKRDK